MTEGTVTQDELMAAEEKFEESKNLAETAMFNLLSNDVEQISQLKAFIDGCLDYHKQAVDILESLKQTLEEKWVCSSFDVCWSSSNVGSFIRHAVLPS